MSASEDDGSFGVCSDGRICDSESVLRGVGGRDAKRAGWLLSHDGAISAGTGCEGLVDKHHVTFYV